MRAPPAAALLTARPPPITSPRSTGLFQNVDANVTPSGGGYTVEFAFREKARAPRAAEGRDAALAQRANAGRARALRLPSHPAAELLRGRGAALLQVWPPMMKFEVSGSTILPPTVESEVLAEARKSKYTTVRVLAAAKNIVEGYYQVRSPRRAVIGDTVLPPHSHTRPQERGLTFGTISHFDGMETGQVVAHIIEGEISRVSLVYVNPKDGTTSPQGSTRPGVVLRELPFVPGSLYNVEDAKRALRDVFALQLFDNVQVVPRPDEGDPSKVEVDVVLRERPLRTAELELEWGIGPGEGGRPDLVSLTPGGSVFFEHRNLQQEGRQLYGSVSTSNFLAPQDDLGFKVEYVRPYARGEADPRRTALKVAAFNSRKLSPVFTGGPLSDEAPGVWVDRAGAKAALVEQHGRQSRLTYGVALAEVSTRDESGAVCSAGAKALPSGQLDADGPPTTHSGTGTDRLLLGQANLTRDTTYFLNGVLVGARDILTLDVCPGTGSGFPFFNRHSASATRFLALAPTHRRSAAPPPVLVLHARYGGCAGSLASYDAFTLGGPHSCRGYAVGELGASRRVGEAAAELRLPLPGTRTHGFAFVEAVSDLGSSPEVAGNPTAYYRRAGGGACAGVGLKLGATRVEWVSDRNARQGAFYVRFGERF